MFPQKVCALTPRLNRNRFSVFCILSLVEISRLSRSRLEDLALGRVVPERLVVSTSPALSNQEQNGFTAHIPKQLLNQIHVREQHATAAVAGKSQVVERLAVSLVSPDDLSCCRIMQDLSLRFFSLTPQSSPRHCPGRSI